MIISKWKRIGWYMLSICFLVGAISCVTMFNVRATENTKNQVLAKEQLNAPVTLANSIAVSSESELQDAILKMPSYTEYTIVLLQDIELSQTLTIEYNRKLTLTSEGNKKQLLRSATLKKEMIRLYGTSTLVLDHVVMNGNEINANETMIKMVSSSFASITLKNGTELKNNIADVTNGAGAIDFNSSDDRSFILVEDSIIENNKGKQGGSIRFLGKGNLYLNENAKIINNQGITSSDGYGGLFIGSLYVNVYVNEGSLIAYNKSTIGGGIYLYEGSLYVNGGTIANNEALQGGGIYVKETNTKCTIYKGSILQNTANTGSAVFVNSKSGFSMQGGIVKDNVAKQSGTILFNDTITTTIDNVEVAGNIALGLNGNGAGFNFIGANSKLTITNSELSGNISTTGNGAAISFEKAGGELFVDNCDLNANEVNSKSSMGGAIFMNGDNQIDKLGKIKLTIVNSHLQNNKAYRSGGALCLNTGNQEVIINNTIFEDNNAYGNDSVSGYGGAIYLGNSNEQLSHIKMSKTNFVNNEASSYGGGALAIDFKGLGYSDFNECNFYNNHARVGGGIYFLNGEVTLTNCNLYQNKAGMKQLSEGSGGGAIVVDSHSKDSYFKIENCNLYENEAYYGGALMVRSGNVFINNGSIYRNQTSGEKAAGGAGIFVIANASEQSRSNVEINNVEIHNNTAQEAGGGILVDATSFENANLTIRNSNIYENKAKNGAGISANNAKLSILDDSIIKSNIATSAGGGGICFIANTSTLEIENSTIEKNSAPWGAGVFLNTVDSEITIKESQIQSNKAVLGAGAILFEGKNSQLNLQNNSKINRNTATFGGGVVISNVNGTTTLQNCDVYENEASDGGGFAITTGILNLEDGNIFLNKATNGGGILLSEDKLKQESVFLMQGGSIYENSAINGGAVAIFDQYGFAEIKGGFISKNIADKGADVFVGVDKGLRIGNAADINEEIYLTKQVRVAITEHFRQRSIQSFQLRCEDAYTWREVVVADEKCEDATIYTRMFKSLDIHSDYVDATFYKVLDGGLNYEKSLILGPKPIVVSVHKQWKNDDKIKRPKRISVSLFEDGKCIDSVILDEDNQWTYQWNKEWLVPEEEHEYQVDEIIIPVGYSKEVVQNNLHTEIINIYNFKAADFLTTKNKTKTIPPMGDESEKYLFIIIVIGSLCCLLKYSGIFNHKN